MGVSVFTYSPSSVILSPMSLSFFWNISFVYLGRLEHLGHFAPAKILRGIGPNLRPHVLHWQRTALSQLMYSPITDMSDRVFLTISRKDSVSYFRLAHLLHPCPFNRWCGVAFHSFPQMLHLHKIFFLLDIYSPTTDV